MKKIIIAAAVAFGGCVTTEPVLLADGRQGHVVGCSGAGLYGTYVANWGQCYQKAGELCGMRGYDVVDQVGERGLVASGSNLSTTNNRMMMIRCKGPDPVPAKKSARVQ
jgi:hypothetical protein